MRVQAGKTTKRATTGLTKAFMSKAANPAAAATQRVAIIAPVNAEKQMSVAMTSQQLSAKVLWGLVETTILKTTPAMKLANVMAVNWRAVQRGRVWNLWTILSMSFYWGVRGCTSRDGGELTSDISEGFIVQRIQWYMPGGKRDVYDLKQ